MDCTTQVRLSPNVILNIFISNLKKKKKKKKKKDNTMIFR